MTSVRLSLTFSNWDQTVQQKWEIGIQEDRLMSWLPTCQSRRGSAIPNSISVNLQYGVRENVEFCTSAAIISACIRRFVCRAISASAEPLVTTVRPWNECTSCRTVRKWWRHTCTATIQTRSSTANLRHSKSTKSCEPTGTETRGNHAVKKHPYIRGCFAAAIFTRFNWTGSAICPYPWIDGITKCVPTLQFIPSICGYQRIRNWRFR